MKCRFCGQNLKKGETVCPKCQKKVANKTQLIMVAAVAGIALVALLFVLLNAMDLEFLKDKKTEKKKTAAVATENVDKYNSSIDYSLDEETCAAAAEDVVATMNDKKLTNRLLQFYYNWEVSNFLKNNYQYLESMGLDYTRPLNEQKCYYEDVSWEVYLVRSAINTWQQYQAVYALAMEEGFVLSDESKETLATMPADLEAAAKEEGYDDTDAWLCESMHANITVEDYVEYCTLISYYVEYVSVEPTDAQLEQYYSDNEQYFVDNGLGKGSVSVRHILVVPNVEEGAEEISEEAWANCYADAEAILNEWKNGEATDDSFATLAMLYSADRGSSSNGGLYEGITAETAFVEPFLNWCIDGSRRIGDTGIVKTEYGYHIMYFSVPLWQKYAKLWYGQEQELNTVEEAVAAVTVEKFLDKIAILEFELS